mmetsp:Transcript_21378/g.62352  ORF Transcript_21378/g.62352 Transcript_21378/m.62352 type:complete len:307 (-) Transcript_21378:1913-2833(-)
MVKKSMTIHFQRPPPRGGSHCCNGTGRLLTASCLPRPTASPSWGGAGGCAASWREGAGALPGRCGRGVWWWRRRCWHWWNHAVRIRRWGVHILWHCWGGSHYPPPPSAPAPARLSLRWWSWMGVRPWCVRRRCRRGLRLTCFHWRCARERVHKSLFPRKKTLLFPDGQFTMGFLPIAPLVTDSLEVKCQAEVKTRVFDGDIPSFLRRCLFYGKLQLEASNLKILVGPVIAVRSLLLVGRPRLMWGRWRRCHCQRRLPEYSSGCLQDGAGCGWRRRQTPRHISEDCLILPCGKLADYGIRMWPGDRT